MSNITHNYYAQRFKKTSTHYAQLGWESHSAQNARFQMLLEHIDIANNRVLDVGCGFGDLYALLCDQKIPVRYVGIDIMYEMVEKAARLHLNGRFLCLDLLDDGVMQLGKFDIIYASGIFNLRHQNNYEYLRQSIERFGVLCSVATVFNLLIVRSQSKEDTYYYYDPAKVYKLLTDYYSNVVMIDQYLQNDATFICSKE